ncbi:response regulator transcription factor [Kineothrix sp. MB12-C1]|uniref:response regulator transcription factor n=1 Tax=Kineothrix sp. MB12-C1 TaxID=3070215 RepID=UPI0027D29C1A|nr:response regulator transcription factor [Kineothrix sp. MB12-C1]WMC94516.1 response regulator transcription factor [Kineothrix sp. MB12-C1]
MALIYVVEDDKNIREIEVFALKNAGYEIKDFEYARDFYEEMECKKPDIVLLDIMLPDEDGLEIVRKLRSNKETKDISIILVTAKTSEIDKVRGLDIGADDYMVKPFGVMELISRVKALLRRSNKNEEKVLRIGAVCLDEERHMVTVDDVPCELTYKEYELLKLLMSNAGIVTPRDMILDKIWGTDFEGESRTLDMHIKTLRQKLRDSSSMIKTVRNVGYIFAN